MPAKIGKKFWITILWGRELYPKSYPEGIATDCWAGFPNPAIPAV